MHDKEFFRKLGGHVGEISISLAEIGALLAELGDPKKPPTKTFSFSDDWHDRVLGVHVRAQANELTASDFYDGFYLLDAIGSIISVPCRDRGEWVRDGLDLIAAYFRGTNIVTPVDSDTLGPDHCRPRRDLGATRPSYQGWRGCYMLDVLQWASGALKICLEVINHHPGQSYRAILLAREISIHVLEKYASSPGIQHSELAKLVQSAAEKKRLLEYEASGYLNDKIPTWISCLALAEAIRFETGEDEPRWCAHMNWMHWLEVMISDVFEVKDGLLQWDMGNILIADNPPHQHRAPDTSHARRVPWMIHHIVKYFPDTYEIDLICKGLGETLSRSILQTDERGRVNATNYIDGDDSPARDYVDQNGSPKGMAGMVYCGWEYVADEAGREKLWTIVKQIEDGANLVDHPDYSGSNQRNGSVYGEALRVNLEVLEMKEEGNDD